MGGSGTTVYVAEMLHEDEGNTVEGVFSSPASAAAALEELARASHYLNKDESLQWTCSGPWVPGDPFPLDAELAAEPSHWVTFRIVPHLVDATYCQ